MGEALRNVVVLVWALSAVNSNAQAKPNVTVIAEEVSSSQPTIVYGAAKEKNGQKDEVIVEQPAAGDNPLGNPIVSPSDGQGQTVPMEEDVPSVNSEIKKMTPEINEITPQNPKISPENTPQKTDNEIQNTLYESGNRIYDVQSYPVKDINTLTEPNVDNEVVNYPIY